MLEYLKIAGIAMLVILAAKFILHLDLKKVIGIAINALIGMIALWLINLTGLVSIPINIITCLVVGLFSSRNIWCSWYYCAYCFIFTWCILVIT